MLIKLKYIKLVIDCNIFTPLITKAKEMFLCCAKDEA